MRRYRFSLALLVLTILFAGYRIGFSQGPLTNALNLMLRSDSNGALYVYGVAAGAQGPLTNLGNMMLRAYSPGALAVTVAGGTITPDIIQLSNGSASAPSLTFASETTLGMLRSGTGKAGFAAGGDQVFGWDANGVRIGVPAISAPATTAQLHGAGNGADIIWITSAASDSNVEAELIHRRSRNTIASPTNVAAADLIGKYLLQPMSGGSYQNAGKIEGVVGAGAFTNGNIPPTLWNFYTSAANTAAALAFRLTDDQVAYAPNAFAVGGSPAASGDLRMRNGGPINYRNAANSADLQMIASNGSNQVEVSNNTGSTRILGSSVTIDNIVISTGLTQAALGTPANGTIVYCSDCTIANPCAGGGTGAFAKRLNGVWVCN